MTALARYDEACRAVAAARSVDEAKDLVDKAEAMRIYGRQAKNRDLEIDAAEIRLRAERRLGELIRAEKDAGNFARGGQPYQERSTGAEEEPVEKPATLAELGIDKKLSSRAQKMAAVPEAKFEGMLGEWRDRIGDENQRVTVNLLREGDKAQRRAEREAELAERQRALPARRYGVILADPEWRFEVYSRQTGMDRAADNHYPTSDLDAIKARPVADIAADDSALFLWATVPMLPQALAVMEAWGFDYKSHVMWWKDRTGTGYWFRNEHEILLVGTRGKIPAPAPGSQSGSVIDAPVGKHSAKPDAFYALIEAYFPNLPKIELNARQARLGWDAWGLEAPPHDPNTGEILEPDVDAPGPQSNPGGDHEVVEESRRDIPSRAGEGHVVSPVNPALDGFRDDLEIPNFLRRTA